MLISNYKVNISYQIESSPILLETSTIGFYNNLLRLAISDLNTPKLQEFEIFIQEPNVSICNIKFPKEDKEFNGKWILIKYSPADNEILFLRDGVSKCY